ncbi:intradiol ring-cleavage dioxygenase [Actinoallomurus purpureus]|uniref:intradiol ring-cleavage dioxygenase n=1 Tax=Actinoallomurus purpureus TaxID=478114 RepID=UPI002093461B|nr:intradiol ring-cleavage dioxygenase [Actinoallomurus purpureus]MCO6006222.1 intradiol ring-cleavage dioxygenase [Actinoallomurus purpureus]
MTDHENQGQSPESGAVNRRAALTALGGASLGAAGIVALGSTAGASTAHRPSAPRPACVLAPELVEGPYYLDYDLFRRDITEHKDGVPLILRAVVVDATTCAPIPRAALDIWHTDALGEYSGYTAMGVGGANGGGPGGPGGGTPPTGTPTAPPPGSPPPGGGGGHAEPTDKLTFLRGVQLTDRHGVVEFRTLYPGWYMGRAIHIHAKVHIGGKVVGRKYTGGHVAHTGQFFFDEKVTERIAKLQPYVINTTHRTTLDEDGIYRNGGSAGLLTLRPLRKGPTTHGLLATVVVGVHPDATP